MPNPALLASTSAETRRLGGEEEADRHDRGKEGAEHNGAVQLGEDAFGREDMGGVRGHGDGREEADCDPGKGRGFSESPSNAGRIGPGNPWQGLRPNEFELRAMA
ncbi:hypothetical protein GCM10007170_41790 [Arthrobacter liuii]|uniref:Uncharacterized protein n=1 Tax=Arthrobacter liuii TaxID=1476996 RepID=A0ABQ2AXY2_9MICC|nr:hypothetical protein GCM10007170_41790 [Arthrobacter liuii]